MVMTAAMRPSTALSADGPLNIYNAVAIAADEDAAAGDRLPLEEALVEDDGVFLDQRDVGQRAHAFQLDLVDGDGDAV